MSLRLDFVGVGPQRTASSWLYEVLKTNRKIQFPAGVKETMFFDQRYEKGIEWYLWHFDKNASDCIRGEIAPTYFDSPDACERIKSHFPNLKVVINVRNPIERCHSLFRHHLSKGRVNNNFADAIKKIPQIVSSGHYRQHCKLWEDNFGTPLYVVNEDVKTEPESVLIQLNQFLQTDCELPTDLLREKINSADSPRFGRLAFLASKAATLARGKRLHKLVEFGKRLGLKKIYSGGQQVAEFDECTKSRLRKIYAEDIAWLENRLSRDFSSWRQT